MNLILSFDSAAKRDVFLERLNTEAPTLLERSYRAKRLPNVIFESLSEAEESQLREMVESFGGVAFGDIRFETMEPR